MYLCLPRQKLEEQLPIALNNKDCQKVMWRGRTASVFLSLVLFHI